MRETFTFTIDPVDAKDFDDAISFESLPDEDAYQIGVHIADVSYYVRPNTKIDDEAYERGTSVYLVDKVLPMLPEELCNDKCSLRPGEDKLCMSVIFTMDKEARILKHKICRTVIRSDVRLNYDQAQEIICANQTNETQSRENRYETTTRAERENIEPTTRVIPILNDLASKLRAARLAAGALAIEQDEIRFHLDEHGHPTDIYFESPNEAHHLIEEFMLLANRTIATAVGSGRPFVYRVHDLPDGDKLAEVEAYKSKIKNQKSRSSRYAGHSTEGLKRAIDILTIRAQAKAVYSTYNIGHYGLAFSHYTHFTSPIRRYPDLMVHRLVEKYILTGKKVTITREELEMMCQHCSEREQEAAQAERDSIKLFQSMWISDHIGEVLTGYISGITDFGIFVQLDESRCEGLIHISKIGDIKKFNLGDAVTVKVVRADVNKSQIDFDFA